MVLAWWPVSRFGGRHLVGLVVLSLILTMAMTGIWVGWVAKGLLGLLGF